jgi:ferritin-like metal-binding protein YciE
MSLEEVLIDELRDLYSAELQLTKALPKMQKAAKDPALKSSFMDHLEQTKGQVERLKTIFQHLGKKPTGETCHGMQGLIEEGQEAIGKDLEPVLKDIALTGAALRVEHYEVAGYSTAILIAKQLGQREIVTLLNETLEEEKATAKLLVAGSKPLLKQAGTLGADEEED